MPARPSAKTCQHRGDGVRPQHACGSRHNGRTLVTTPGGRWRGMTPVILGALLFVSLAIRLPFATEDFGFSDVKTYRRWAQTIATRGLATIYDGTDVGYPPLLLYVFGSASLLATRLPPALQRDDRALTALIKLPSMLADVATAWLIARALRRHPPALQILACAAYALHPALWYVSAYWGQTDSVYTFFLVVSVVALARGAVIPAWVAYGLALATKPQSIVLAPLLVVGTLRRYGARRVAAGLVACTVVGAVMAMPWLVAGQPSAPFRPYTVQMGPPRADVSAYNLWYLVLLGRVHRVSSAVQPFGLPISYKQIGNGLFVALVLLIVGLAWRQRGRAVGVPAALLNLGMFVLLTQGHERYMLSTLPFVLLAAAGWDGRPEGSLAPRPIGLGNPGLWWAYGALSLTFLFNLVTIASFAPTLWINLVVPQPATLLVRVLKGLSLVAAAANTVALAWLLGAFARKTFWDAAVPARRES